MYLCMVLCVGGVWLWLVLFSTFSQQTRHLPLMWVWCAPPQLPFVLSEWDVAVVMTTPLPELRWGVGELIAVQMLGLLISYLSIWSIMNFQHGAGWFFSWMFSSLGSPVVVAHAAATLPGVHIQTFQFELFYEKELCHSTVSYSLKFYFANVKVVMCFFQCMFWCHFRRSETVFT